MNVCAASPLRPVGDRGAGVAILAAGPYPGRNRAGNAVFLLPEKRAVVVMTTTNFSERQSHAFTRTLLTRELIPAL